MQSSTEDNVEGKLKKAKGDVKEAVGNVTNNPDLEIEGRADKVEGKEKEKTGDIKKVFNK